jgi:hypothetical protein
MLLADPGSREVKGVVYGRWIAAISGANPLRAWKSVVCVC